MIVALYGYMMAHRVHRSWVMSLSRNQTHLRLTIPLGNDQATLSLPKDMTPEQWEYVRGVVDIARDAVVGRETTAERIVRHWDAERTI